MRKYSLDDLTYFAEHGMQRATMLRAMQDLGIDEDAVYALWASDSARNRDVIRLYRDYGRDFGPQIERYIDSVLKARPIEQKSAAGEPRYSLGQLAWVHEVGMFRDDMSRDLRTLGAPADAARKLSHTAGACGSIVEVWAIHGQQHGELIRSYLDKVLSSYRPGWPHPAPPARAHAHQDDVLSEHEALEEAAYSP